MVDGLGRLLALIDGPRGGRGVVFYKLLLLLLPKGRWYYFHMK